MVKLRNLSRRVAKLFFINFQVYKDYRERQLFFNTLVDPIDYWNKFPQSLFENCEPVFVLSTGRCGTELLTRILLKLPKTACYHAPFPELLNSEKMAYEEGLEKFDSYKTAVRTARFELIMDCMLRGRQYVETNYRITFFAPHLYSLFPKSRFVHLVRSPTSFVRSGLRLGFYQGLHTDIGRITPNNGAAAEKWSSMSSTEKMAWLWNETNEYIERFKANSDPQRILTVKAEDLYSNPETTQRIISFCGRSAPSSKKIAKWIKHRVNVKESQVAVPPFEDWKEGQKNEVRRWIKISDQYGYSI